MESWFANFPLLPQITPRSSQLPKPDFHNKIAARRSSPVLQQFVQSALLENPTCDLCIINCGC